MDDERLTEGNLRPGRGVFIPAYASAGEVIEVTDREIDGLL